MISQLGVKRKFNIAALMISISPLLAYYNFPGTSISMSTIVTLLTAAILVFNTYKYRIGLTKYSFWQFAPYVLLISYNLLITLITSTSPSSSINITAYYTMFILIAGYIQIQTVDLLSSNFRDLYENFKKYYLFICFMISFLAISFQIIYTFTGQYFPCKIPFLPLTSSFAQLDYRFGYNSRGEFMAFSPFFSEPSHMAQYMLPAVVILMQQIGKRGINFVKCLIQIVMIGLAIIISSSSFGILSVVLTVLVYVYLGNNEASRKIRRILLIIIPVALVIIIFGSSNRLTYEIQTIIEGLSDSGSDKSAYRLYRGFAYFVQIPLINQIFGIGYLNLTSFISTHHLTYAYEIISDNIVSEYINGVSQALIYDGIVGLFLLFVFARRVFIRGNYESRTLVFSWLLLIISTAAYLRGNFIFYISVMLLLKNYRSESDYLGEENNKKRIRV